MADIVREIDTIGDILAPVNVTRFYKQALPAKYVANTIGIRWQLDTDASETAAHYVTDRLYQIAYFGTNEVDCIRKVPQIKALLNQNIKIRLRDTNDYITLVSFNMSQPFKTETDGVYATIGVLATQTRTMREFAPVEKIGSVNVEATTEASDGRTEQYSFDTDSPETPNKCKGAI